MATQSDLDKCYMTVADAHAALSKGIRGKVGACLVTKHGVVLGGCNGMAPNGDNTLEIKEYMKAPENGKYLDEAYKNQRWPYTDECGRYKLTTKPQTIHAELSCILKAAKEGVSVVGSTLYVSLSPCITCSEMIAAAGVKRVVYKEAYRLTDGIENLKKLNLVVDKWEE